VLSLAWVLALSGGWRRPVLSLARVLALAWVLALARSGGTGATL